MSKGSQHDAGDYAHDVTLHGGYAHVHSLMVRGGNILYV
jgi:hypothetical protein